MFGYNTVNNYINITVNNCTKIVFDYYFRILQRNGFIFKLTEPYSWYMFVN